MFDWVKRKRASLNGALVTAQRPGEVFELTQRTALTAVDEVVIALPTALLNGDGPMSSFMSGPDDMQISIPPEGDTFFIRLRPGMTVSLAKSVRSYVVAEDGRPRRIQAQRPADDT